MGATKTRIHSDFQNKMALYAKALGHPARVRIMQYLISVNKCIGNDIVDEVGLAQPTISQHLKELKQVGLVQGNIEGASMCYCINREGLEEAKTIINSFFDLADKTWAEESHAD